MTPIVWLTPWQDSLRKRGIPVREWRLVRDNAPGLDWLGCYELWHRLYARRHRGDVESDFMDTSTAALAGWPRIVYELIQDMATLGSLTRQGHGLDITKEYDLMYRIFMLKDGCGYITIYPDTVKILAGLPPTDVRSHVLIAGDSSLALCRFNKKTKKATHKATFEEPLRIALRTEPRCLGVRILMNWGRGINDIALSIEQGISGPFPPEGVDIFIQWAGNDVYGSHGYMGYMWHIQHPWVTQTWMDREKAENWPAKQRILVDSGVRRIIALQQHPAVRSVTAVLGPQNGDFCNLPEEYDREMARHAKALADGGVTVIDPWPLLLATTREDGYHMETNELNTRMCVTFYKAMVRGNFACRQVWHHCAHFAANDRSVVFNRHFRLGMVEREFHLPPCTDMVVPEVGQEAPVQRCAEEEITFQIPIVQDDEARTAVPEDSVITVGDLDHAFLDREVGEKNVTEDRHPCGAHHRGHCKCRCSCCP